MRLKTFLSAYMLFLCLLFVSVGIVSYHMTGSTVEMLREKGAREFQTISLSLGRDIAAMYSRFFGGQDFQTAVNQLIEEYVRYYRRHGIELGLGYGNAELYGHPHRMGDIGHIFGTYGYGGISDAIITFVREDGEHFVSITGLLPRPFEFYQLSYRLDITAYINEMQRTQRVLWATSIVVSLIAAVFLYVILLKIFKPLEIVTRASFQVADGRYSERIAIKGKNELALVATAFNQMAAQIEAQICLLEDESQRKQQFVDNFAHEIRTPLTSIYGYAEYLQKTNVNEAELIESAGYIMSEANHMKKVANSLLELATLRDYKPTILPIYIPELFDDVKTSLEKPLEERGAKLHCQSFAYSLPGQQDLIKTLLLNLCINAIQSCDVGKGEIFLVSEKEDSAVIITVSDNGCGIPANMLPRLTEPFFRVDKARSRDQGGVGLGLALCKQIADVHGAKIAINSAPDRGTTIKLIFTTP